MKEQQLTISQMNEVIAIFDGYERYQDIYGIWFRREGMIICMHPRLEGLCYHKDWNWLMPVWEKFRDLEFKNVQHQFKHSEIKTVITYAMCYGEKDIAHARIYEAIQWYNQKTK